MSSKRKPRIATRPHSQIRKVSQSFSDLFMLFSSFLASDLVSPIMMLFNMRIQNRASIKVRYGCCIVHSCIFDSFLISACDSTA